VASPETHDVADGPPRSVMVAAVAVAVAAVVGLFVFVALKQTPPQRSPVAVVSVPAPDAEGDACRALLDALPERLGDYERATVAQPTPAGAAAWQRDEGPDGNDTVILRCGLEQPFDFVAGSPIQMVDEVAWFRIGDTGRTTWTTVDRPVYVALTLPDGSGPAPIQLLSEAVARTMPAVAVNPRPAP
jgi:Protein of unknown function (DUF3515)